MIELIPILDELKPLFILLFNQVLNFMSLVTFVLFIINAAIKAVQPISLVVFALRIDAYIDGNVTSSTVTIYFIGLHPLVE